MKEAPLDAEMRALLDSERAEPCRRDAKQRIFRRLEHAAIAMESTTGANAPPASEGSPVAGAAKAAGHGAAGWGLASRGAVALLLLGIGGIGGALLQRGLTPKAPSETHVVMPSIATAAPTALATPPDVAVPVVPAEAPKRPPNTPAAPRSAVSAAPSAIAEPPPPSSELGEERKLLDTARSAVARGAYAAAQAALVEHEARYPDGRLAEERELLTVQALAGAGRAAEARARGERFLERYPRSIFAPAVRAASGM